VGERVTAPEGAPEDEFDVAVIGAGVVGCSVTRELTLRGARVVLLEARSDVGDATSKANTAILHTGFDAKPGTLESALVRRGQALLRGYARRTGIPVEVTGALLVAWDEEQAAALPALAEQAAHNGYDRTRMVGVEEVRRLEPHLGPGALGALEVPDESVICPWTTTLAFATEAVRAGAQLRLETELTGAETVGDAWVLTTTTGRVRSRHVVNAAGLRSDAVHRMFGHDGFTVRPRRGELVVFDKLARSLVGHILLPVPTSMGKGVLIAPTIYGNVLLGPTAEDVDDPDATESTEHGLALLREKGASILPALLEEEVTTIYAGMRAATEHGDYQISFHTAQRYACLGGIRSTGLTSSMAIAELVAATLADQAGLAVGDLDDGDPPAMSPLGEACLRPYADSARIGADPAYGEIVCFCERVSLGEIRDAMRGDIPARSPAGLRRRTRAGMGRCQGFFCGATVRRLLDEDGAATGHTAAVAT
jgi:glycerol-3-phosphate dehydrogenase